MNRVPGIRFDAEGLANIWVWAPFAKTVEMLLVVSDEKLRLTAAEFGYWYLQTDSMKPGDAYFIVLDHGKQLPDVASLSQPQGVHGASVAVGLQAYQWTDGHWRNPKLEDYIFYELHTGTFTPEGTFAAIENKLDYLLELGITAIELMPIAQFPGGRNWGYDGVFPFAVQHSYGGARGLMHLIDTCHQKGLAVVIDVVYNHLGPEGNYFSEFGPYFTEKYHTPWGNAINFDDAWCDGVRNYFVENALMWLRDFRADALRLDAVHAIKDFNPVHILREIKQRVNRLMEETGKHHYLIIELDLNDNRFIDSLDKHGYGMDAQWIDEFHHALRVSAGGERTGYYEDFNGINQLAKSYTDAYVYDGIFSPHRHKTFGKKAEGNEGSQFVVFSQNHDQVGNRMLGERSSQLFSFEMQKLMAGAVFVAPYLPLLFMGEEYSTQTPFLYFTSHGDKDLAEAVRKGRKAEFKDFQGGAEAPDPQEEITFNRSILNWDETKKDKGQKMLDYYQTLIALRKQLPALHVLNRANLSVAVREDTQTLTIRRWQQEQEVCIIMNFSKQQQLMKPVPFKGQVILDSADDKWNGQGSLAKENVIQPESLIIYINGYV
jgi:maltooligosyltrehalose trehalohydrolase